MTCLLGVIDTCRDINLLGVIFRFLYELTLHLTHRAGVRILLKTRRSTFSHLICGVALATPKQISPSLTVQEHSVLYSC
jgi:hypothetical protein